MSKKTPIKGKKVGKTVIFEAKPKVDPFARPSVQTNGIPVGTKIGRPNNRVRN